MEAALLDFIHGQEFLHSTMGDVLASTSFGDLTCDRDKNYALKRAFGLLWWLVLGCSGSVKL